MATANSPPSPIAPPPLWNLRESTGSSSLSTIQRTPSPASSNSQSTASSTFSDLPTPLPQKHPYPRNPSHPNPPLPHPKVPRKVRTLRSRDEVIFAATDLSCGGQARLKVVFSRIPNSLAGLFEGFPVAKLIGVGRRLREGGLEASKIAHCFIGRRERFEHSSQFQNRFRFS